MAERKSLLVNIAIFPKIMTIAIGKPIQEDIRQHRIIPPPQKKTSSAQNKAKDVP